MTDRPTSLTDRLRRLPLWQKAGLGLIIAAVFGVALLWHNRISLARDAAQRALAEAGLQGVGFDITHLTPWSFKIENLSVAGEKPLDLRSAEAEITWPSPVSPVVKTVRLAGLDIQIAIKDGTVDWGVLQPVMSRPASGGGTGRPPLQRLEVIKSKVTVGLPAGPVTVDITNAEAEFKPGGQIDVPSVVARLSHAAGWLGLEARAITAANGGRKAELEISGGTAEHTGLRLTGLAGKATAVWPHDDPLAITGQAGITIDEMTAPGGFLAKVSAALKKEGNNADLTLDAEDMGKGLTLVVKAAAGLAADAKVDVSSRLNIADLTRLGLLPGVAGRAEMTVATTVGMGEILTGDIAETRAATVSVNASGLSAPGIGGLVGMTGGGTVELSHKAPFVTRLEDVTAEIDLDNVNAAGVTAKAEKFKATARGRLNDIGIQVDGEIGLSGGGAQGRIELGGSVSYQEGRISYRNNSCDRLTLQRYETPGFQADGPLTLCLRPEGDGGGLWFDRDAANGWRGGAALAFKAETPSLTVRLQDTNEALVRTARVEGGMVLQTRSGGLPDGVVRMSGLGAVLPEFDVEVRGVFAAAKLKGGAGIALDYSAQSLSQYSLAPFSLSGKGKWNGARLSTEGTLRQPRSGLIASYRASGGGGEPWQGRIDTLPLNLTGIPGGVHAMTPLLRPFVKAVTGTAQVSAKVEGVTGGAGRASVQASLTGAGITPAGPVLPAAVKGLIAGLQDLKVEAEIPIGEPAAGRAAVALHGGNLTFGKTRIDGIGGTLEISRLSPLASPPGQVLRIDRLFWGVPITNLLVNYRLTPEPGMHIADASVEGVGGRLAVSDVTVGPAGLPKELTINVSSLRLKDIAQVFNIVGLEADGRISGEIPLELGADGGIAIRDGILRAIEAGSLSFVPPTRKQMVSGNARMAMVMDILENLKFDHLSVEVDGDARKDVRLTFRIKGRNPKFQEGHPVDLTINLSGNLGEALEAELQNFNVLNFTGKGRGQP